MRSKPLIRLPARASIPSRSSACLRSAASVRSPRSVGTRTSFVLKARKRAAFSFPLALAESSSERVTPIQAPRPGARARTSGATSPSGESASRISSSLVPLRRVRMHVRSGTCGSLSASARLSFRGVRIGGLLRLARGLLVLEPVGAGSHDDLVALLFGEAILGEDTALVLRPVARLAAARLDPLLLHQLVGGQVSKIVERLNARLAQCDQHLLGEVRKLGEVVGDAETAAHLPGSGFA